MTAAQTKTEGPAQTAGPVQHRVLVTGSREWTDFDLVNQALDAALALLQVPLTEQDTVTLVHGDARGLDTLAAVVAGSRGWKVEEHPARWSEHSADCPAWHFAPVVLPTWKMAGHRRNHEMIALGADLVLAFPMGDEGSGMSRGTWGCARAAKAAQLPTLVLGAGGALPARDDDSKVHRAQLDSAARVTGRDLLLWGRRRVRP